MPREDSPLRMDRDIGRVLDLIDEIRALNVAKGWRRDVTATGPRSGPWFAAYVALGTSEWAEALDAYRDKVWSATCEATEPGQEHIKGCSGKPHSKPKPVGVGPELADALIRLFDVVDIWDVNILYETRRVLDYGWTRPFQHGGRIL